MAWNNLELNSNLVKVDTGKATLIKIPKTKYLFWHPSKLVRTFGKGGYMISIGYTEDFTFKVFRNGEGKHNFMEKIEEYELEATEFIDRFFTITEDE